MLPKSKKPTPKFTEYPSVKRENTLQSKLVCLPDTLSLLGDKKSQDFIAKHQTQINSWHAPQDREGSRVKVPHGNSCKLSLSCKIDTRRDLLLPLWAPKMAPSRPSRRHTASSQSIKMRLRPSAKDKKTPE